LLWNWIRQLRNRRRLQTEVVLADLYWLAQQHAEPTRASHATAVLRSMASGRGVRRSLQELATRGWVRQTGALQWTLTAEGLAAARKQLGPEADS
jgi:hypothetical protein